MINYTVRIKEYTNHTAHQMQSETRVMPRKMYRVDGKNKESEKKEGGF
jgi:hypothetical protein